MFILKLFKDIIIIGIMKSYLMTLIFTVFVATFSYGQETLKPTADSVLMKFFVSDWDNVPEVESKVTLENVLTSEKVEFVSDIDGKYEILLPKNTTYKAEIYRFDTTFVFDASEGKELKIPDMSYLTYSHQFMIKIMQETSSNSSASADQVPNDSKSYKRIFNLDILFPTAQWRLNPKDLKELNDLVDQLKENPSMKIELAAHTDNVGDDASNMRLSQQRANSVRDYLVEKGIADARMMSKGYGEKKPIATNETSEGRALNRRTECRVIYE